MGKSNATTDSNSNAPAERWRGVVRQENAHCRAKAARREQRQVPTREELEAMVPAAMRDLRILLVDGSEHSLADLVWGRCKQDWVCAMHGMTNSEILGVTGDAVLAEYVRLCGKFEIRGRSPFEHVHKFRFERMGLTGESLPSLRQMIRSADRKWCNRVALHGNRLDQHAAEQLLYECGEHGGIADIELSGNSELTEAWLLRQREHMDLQRAGKFRVWLSQIGMPVEFGAEHEYDSGREHEREREYEPNQSGPESGSESEPTYGPAY